MSLKRSQTIPKKFQASKRLPASPNRNVLSSNSQITYQTPTESSQNNMFLRHGSNNIQKHQKPTKRKKTKNPRPSSSMHKLVPFGSKIGSYVVPTWFLRFSIVQIVVPTNLNSHLLVHMHMQCSKIGLRDVQVGSRC